MKQSIIYNLEENDFLFNFECFNLSRNTHQKNTTLNFVACNTHSLSAVFSNFWDLLHFWPCPGTSWMTKEPLMKLSNDIKKIQLQLFKALKDKTLIEIPVKWETFWVTNIFQLTIDWNFWATHLNYYFYWKRNDQPEKWYSIFLYLNENT